MQWITGRKSRLLQGQGLEHQPVAVLQGPRPAITDPLETAISALAPNGARGTGATEYYKY